MKWTYKIAIWITALAFGGLLAWFLWDLYMGNSALESGGSLACAAAILAARRVQASALKAAEAALKASQETAEAEKTRRAAADAKITDDAARAAQAAVNGTDWDKGEDVLYNDWEV